MTEVEIRELLEPLEVPLLGRTLGSLNLVRAVECCDHRVELKIAAPLLNELAQGILKVQLNRELKKLPGIDQVEVAYMEAKPAELNEIKHVIAVMSGKGGVGKSLVSGLLAAGLTRQGCRVGILDADITGPSIPKMFGLKEKPIGCPEGILPVMTSSGIAVMSINLVLENEDEAVIWRGPLIANAIKQFWGEVFWGKLDYLIVDLPPGTADVPLTVLQSLPTGGIVIVFTPQELTAMIVRKAVNMTRHMNKPILGLVENMSYFCVPGTDQKLELFGKSHGIEMAQTLGVPLLAQIPIDPELAKFCDSGRIEECQLEVVQQIALGIAQSAVKEGKDSERQEG